MTEAQSPEAPRQTHAIVSLLYSLLVSAEEDGGVAFYLLDEGAERLREAFRAMKPEEHFDALIALVATLDFFALSGSPELKWEVKAALMPIFDPEGIGHLPDHRDVEDTVRFIGGGETDYAALLAEDEGAPKQRWWELR